nr:hypothetical protein [Tanacetum cinerariifolium]
MQTQTSNTLHNAIMEAGSKDRPPMLEPGNYVQWKSRIKRYVDTKPNHEFIHYCLKNPPYELGIHNDIYSTIDACPNACEMWKAIEWLKQGEAINVQDLETNLYWEFGKFTSQDGESLESYYLSKRNGNVAGARETVGSSMQSESVHETYLIEQDVHNVIIESVDMNSDSEQIDQNDEDADLAKE